MNNKNIKIISKERHIHSKASEEYIEVEFIYPESNYCWKGWIPVEYRRTGISIPKDSEAELIEYIEYVYEEMNPCKFTDWCEEQNRFWREEKRNASITKSFFDVLKIGGWHCVECSLPRNLNWARRIQDLKEFGYTISTDTSRFCNKCGQSKTHIILLPIRRGVFKGNGYETFSIYFRKRIIKLLKGIDVYENSYNAHCLPDHKFSEIRWNEKTKDINDEEMSDDDIVDKFQLLTNQRNQQKREICRKCFQTGKRGIIFGIKFFYEGDENWDNSIPKKGKEAEKGCIGCAWYDIEKWRKELIKVIKRNA